MTVLLIDVGCLECGHPTEVTGLYPDVAEAKAAVETFGPDGWQDADSMHWGGDGMMVIIDLDADPPAVIANTRGRPK
jgi:hypothetical protein